MIVYSYKVSHRLVSYKRPLESRPLFFSKTKHRTVVDITQERNRPITDAKPRDQDLVPGTQEYPVFFCNHQSIFLTGGQRGMAEEDHPSELCVERLREMK